MTDDFHGAKLAILAGNAVVTILRDDVPHIPWPGHWDLPGGAREGNETPLETVLRETEEELGLLVDPSLILWSIATPSPPSAVWFHVAEWPDFDPTRVRFGDEGRRWALAPLHWFLTRARVVPSQRRRLSAYLERRDAIRATVPGA